MSHETNSSFHIRTATIHDVTALAALTHELMLHERALAQSTHDINPWAATADEVRKQINLPNTCFFVAECEQQIVGFLRAIIVGLQLPREAVGTMGWLHGVFERLARWSFTFFLRRPRPAFKVESGYIAGTFVAVDVRGLGIGKALAHAAENWFAAHGLEHSELHVLFKNETARHMWEELGYEPLALGMRKKLAEPE